MNEEPEKTSLWERFKHAVGWTRKLPPWPIVERRTPRPPLSRRLSLILTALTIGYTTFVFAQADEALDKVEAEATGLIKEAEARRDQTCVIFEREWHADVRRLANTYAYLRTISEEDRDDALYVTIVRLLPQTEEAVRLGKPPEYCDPRDVGLSEPYPEIPSRPDSLDLPDTPGGVPE